MVTYSITIKHYETSGVSHKHLHNNNYFKRQKYGLTDSLCTKIQKIYHLIALAKLEI